MDTDDLHDESGVEDRRGEGGEDTEVISEVISDSDSSRSQDTEGSGDEGEEDMGDGEEEEEDEEGEEDDEDEEDEDDEDDDGGSEVYDDDQEDDYQDLDDAAFFRVPTLEREFEPVMMIGLGEHDPLEERAGGLPLWGETEPNGVVDIAGGLGGGSAAGGAGANHVTPTHPLLMGRGLAAGSGEANGGVAGGAGTGTNRTQSRSAALQRHRGFRYIQLNPRAGGAAGGPPPGTPAILQSLLGGPNSRDFLTFTGAGAGMRDARVLVMDNTFAIFDGLDDELPGVGLDGGMLGSLGGGVGGSGGASALNTIPTALVRWTEESRVLDGDSVHDCVTAIKPLLLEVDI